MPAFEYTALDARGARRRGVLAGDSARQVRERLRAQGLVPVAVAPVEGAGPRGARGPRLAGGELALITRQLATLLAAALPVDEALAALERQAHQARVRRVLAGVRARVAEGEPLAAALGAFPRAFPPLYRAAVAAGEQSGRLAAVLERLAGYVETREVLRQRLALALVYPAILTVVALAVALGLVAYVVPQVLEIFRHTGQPLPALTRGLLAASHALREWGPAAAALGALAAAGIAALLRHGPARLRWDRLRLRLPVLGPLALAAETARLARTLAMLTGAGIPVLQALGIAREVLGNRALREALAEAERRVAEGEPLSRALAAGGRFPPLAAHLAASGESSGRLPAMLERLAEVEEREAEARTGLLLALLEPALILLMGGLVLAIVLAVLLPVFELNQLVR